MSCQQLSFFDFNGKAKLAAESIEEREAIVRHHAKQGAIFFVSTSGGSDSCAMAILIQSLVPHSQIIYVHAHLGEVEHPGIIEHIKRFKPKSIPLYIVECEAKNFFNAIYQNKQVPFHVYETTYENGLVVK